MCLPVCLSVELSADRCTDLPICRFMYLANCLSDNPLIFLSFDLSIYLTYIDMYVCVCVHTYRQTASQPGRQTDRQADRHTDGLTNYQTDRLTDRHTDRHRHIRIHIHTDILHVLVQMCMHVYAPVVGTCTSSGVHQDACKQHEAVLLLHTHRPLSSSFLWFIVSIL